MTTFMHTMPTITMNVLKNACSRLRVESLGFRVYGWGLGLRIEVEEPKKPGVGWRWL